MKLDLDKIVHKKLLAAVFETVGVDKRLWRAMAASLRKNDVPVEAVFFTVSLMHKHSPKIYGDFIDFKSAALTSIAVVDDYLLALKEEVHESNSVNSSST